SVCDQTGGLFARAEDAQSLSRVYEQIQTLKPSPRTRTEVEFLTYERPILLLAALLVAAAIGLRATILRVIPAC
ncbi:MAG TPA: aerotolerance regulator BatA, partial [Planctomycetota bacterium]|nr:aerotolerance regulator BatA [Planctomycetota bacterium]